MIPRGFKASAERESTKIRGELGLSPSSPMSARLLCNIWGIDVLRPNEIPGMPTDLISRLPNINHDSWSAFTIPTGSSHIIIVNPMHSKYREESDLMHELSHLILNHTPSHFMAGLENILPIRNFDSQQEDEARWFGGVMQLPRPALLTSVRQGMSNEEISIYYGASMEMVTYRRRMTAVDRQKSTRVVKLVR